MDRRLERKNKAPKGWLYCLLFFGVIMIFIYAGIESSVSARQPSKNWSLGMKVLDDTPNDFRKIDYINKKGNEGITLSYVVDQGIRLQELNKLGEIERSLDIAIDSSSTKLLSIQQVDDKYNIYISDRKVLNKIDVDINDLTIGEEIRISNHSEQFDIMGNSIIVGDDDRTDIIIDGEIVATYEDYEDLKKVRIKENEGKTYASMDTIYGGDIIVINDGQVIKKNLTNEIDQDTYGYISDLSIEGNVVTVLSHYFNITDSQPTLIGAWQLNANNLEEIDFWLWKNLVLLLKKSLINLFPMKLLVFFTGVA